MKSKIRISRSCSAGGMTSGRDEFVTGRNGFVAGKNRGLKRQEIEVKEMIV